MAKKKSVTLRARHDAWLAAHPTLGDFVVGVCIALALIALFLFVTFSGFGASAEFIYNQF